MGGQVKLGCKVLRGRVNSKGFTIGVIRDYRVIGLNPRIKLQEVLIVNGFEELGEIEEFEWTLSKSLRLLFPPDHLVYKLFGGDWSHTLIGDF